MINIDYVLTVKATITFDGIFEYTALNDKFYSLDVLIETAEDYMENYNFDYAQIIDTETGEILIKMEMYKDENDYLPEYYDDGITCGYE